MNCIIIDDDKLSRRIVEEFVNKTEGLTLIESYETAVNALNVLKDEDTEIHLIFLDIEMPDMSGIA
jgi:two-component SAPR family response regulator